MPDGDGDGGSVERGVDGLVGVWLGFIVASGPDYAVLAV